MTWLLLVLLTLAALAPFGFALLRPARTRGRREADLALYRAQLAELEREHAAGRLDEAGHRAAVLEVQRRLLAAPEEGSATAAPGRGRGPLLVALVAVPMLALGIYLVQGTPDMPSAPWSLRHAQAERDEQLLALLRARLAQLDQTSEAARKGYVLLGNAERSRGHLEAAADAYRHALAGHFDADLTGQLAQVLLEDGKVEAAARLLAAALPQAPKHIGLRFLSGLAEARAGRPEVARSTWRALIADAPEGAPWRAMVERRMQDLP